MEMRRKFSPKTTEANHILLFGPSCFKKYGEATTSHSDVAAGYRRIMGEIEARAVAQV